MPTWGCEHDGEENDLVGAGGQWERVGFDMRVRERGIGVVRTQSVFEKSLLTHIIYFEGRDTWNGRQLRPAHPSQTSLHALADVEPGLWGKLLDLDRGIERARRVET